MVGNSYFENHTQIRCLFCEITQMSSHTSKLVLLLSCSGTVGVIAYVHLKQQIDRERMHEGVVKDMERQQRKIENVYILEKQKELTKKLKQELEQ